MANKKDINVSSYNEFIGGWILQFKPDFLNHNSNRPTLTPFEYAVTKDFDFFIHLN